MADQQLFVQNQATTLAGAGVSQGDTSIVLSSLAQIDGTLLTMSDFGSKGYATIEPGNGTQEEAITFTGITQNINGTATLTGVKNQSTVSPYTETSGLSMTHAGGTTLIITNTAGFYDGLSGKSNDETVTGKWTFPGGGSANAPVSGTQYAEPTDTLEYASKGYVDSVAIAGGAKASNTVYGLTRLSTAAVVATEPIAVGDNDTRVPTQNENNALVGNDPVTSPSSTNKYMTQSGFQRGTEIYAYSSTQTDAYAVTLSPAVTSYVEGMLVRFKADVGNVGTATLAVSGLSPITIKKNVTENLADNDIQGSQVVEVIYDANPSPAFQLVGANFISKANATTLTNGSDASSLHTHNTSLQLFQGAFSSGAIPKTYFVSTIPFMSATAPALTLVGSPTITYFITAAHLVPGSDTFTSLRTTNTPFITVTHATDGFKFSTTKKVVVEFGLRVGGTGSESMGWGLMADATSGSPIDTYNDADIDAACFTVDSSGNLYGHTSNGNGTTNHTETVITGITMTNWNIYRIEFNPTVDVKFYVNGVLKATNTTTLPNDNEIYFALGSSGNTSSNYPTGFSAVTFAVEN